jgi:hypothetical protein
MFSADAVYLLNSSSSPIPNALSSKMTPRLPAPDEHYYSNASFDSMNKNYQRTFMPCPILLTNCLIWVVPWWPARSYRPWKHHTSGRLTCFYPRLETSRKFAKLLIQHENRTDNATRRKPYFTKSREGNDGLVMAITKSSYSERFAAFVVLLVSHPVEPAGKVNHFLKLKIIIDYMGVLLPFLLGRCFDMSTRW